MTETQIEKIIENETQTEGKTTTETKHEGPHIPKIQ
jgi:hypothetical protein